MNELLDHYNEYINTADVISAKDRDGKLVESKIKLFDFDEIAKYIKMGDFKTVDSFYYKENKLYLIEFKGGKEFNKEIKQSLQLKALESLLIVFPKMLTKTCKEFLELELEVHYIVIYENENKCNSVRNRLADRKIRYNREIQFNLEKYKNIFFKQIWTESAYVFDNKMTTHIVNY